MTTHTRTHTSAHRRVPAAKAHSGSSGNPPAHHASAPSIHSRMADHRARALRREFLEHNSDSDSDCELLLEGSDAEPVTQSTPATRRRLRTKTPADAWPKRRPSEIKASYMGITGLEYRRMRRAGLPPWFFGILAALFVQSGKVQEDLHCIEWFAGHGARDLKPRPPKQVNAPMQSLP